MTVKTMPGLNVSAADQEGIREKVLGYVEAWYRGDPELGAASLHPQLAKRRVCPNPETGRSSLEPMSALKLAERWASGDGKATPEDRQLKEITILDVYGGMASVKLEAAAWVDYMHLAKYDDEWMIVNILWERKE